MKRCSKCGEEKPLEEFHNCKTYPSGKAYHCKSCAKENSKHHYHNNRDRYKVTERKSRLKRSFGITVEDFDRMFDEQGGRCAICGATEGSKRFSVDHCHTTGTVRKLLCYKCNIGLGMFNDDPKLLKQAAEYLE